MTGPLFSADAWNNITFTAAEIKNPRRNCPSVWHSAPAASSSYTCWPIWRICAVLPVRGNDELFRQVQQLDKEIDRLKDQDLDAGQLEKTRDELLNKATDYQRGIAYVKDDRLARRCWKRFRPSSASAFMARGHHDFNLRLRQRHDPHGCPALLRHGPG